MTLLACANCHCSGRGWMTLDELAPGKHDDEQGAIVLTCYCACHDARPFEHRTDGTPCWCGPTIEYGKGDDGDVIIHRDKGEAH